MSLNKIMFSVVVTLGTMWAANQLSARLPAARQLLKGPEPTGALASGSIDFPARNIFGAFS